MVVRLFLDTEFTSFQHPEGLSIGIVTEGGGEFYAEVNLRTRPGGQLLKRCGSFVRDEVVPQFRRRPHAITESRAIGARLADWLIKLKASEFEVVYDYATDYELFERWLKTAPAAHKVARLVPVHVGYLLDQEEALQAQEDSWSASEAADGLRRHHALADARALRAAFRAVHERTAGCNAEGCAGAVGAAASAMDGAGCELDPPSVASPESTLARLHLLAEDRLDDRLAVAPDAPLVFLDIDEVICLSELYGGSDAIDAVKGRHSHPDDVYNSLLHRPALRVLHDLHEAMDGQLRYVMTSTWRKHLNRSQMVEILMRSGLAIIAECIERKERWSTVDWPHRTRLNEIAEWMQRNWAGEPFVVIDDEVSGQVLAAARDAPEGPFRRRIVLCREGVGLLPEHLPLLLQALRTEPGRSR